MESHSSTCGRCHAPVPESAKFCSSCGLSFSVPVVAETDQSACSTVAKLIMGAINRPGLSWYRTGNAQHPSPGGGEYVDGQWVLVEKVYVHIKEKKFLSQPTEKTVIAVMPAVRTEGFLFPKGEWQDIQIRVYAPEYLNAAVEAATEFQKLTGKSATVRKVF